MNGRDALGRWAWVEGVTLLVLVLVAMPLKHVYGIPNATRVMGAIHGVAFLLYVSALVRTSSEEKWSAKTWLALLGIAFVPGGIFFYRRLLPPLRIA